MKIKKLVLPLLIFGTMSCGSTNVKTNITTDNSSIKVETITEVTNSNSDIINADSLFSNEANPVGIYESLVTNEVRETISKLHHAEMVEEGGYYETATIIRYFKADAFDIKVAYVQITYIKGGVSESSFVFYYPDPTNDDESQLSSEIYALQEVSDNPCDICTFDDIKIEGDYIVGVFLDNVSHEKIKRYMDYNFLEMNISWVEKPY